MKVTVWDAFFMLLMVIPVSKMLSSIFMKLISRVGTVNEEKWAVMGMGSIMTIAAAAGGAFSKRGGMMGAMRGNASRNAASSGNMGGSAGSGNSAVAMDALGMGSSGSSGPGGGSGGTSAGLGTVGPIGGGGGGGDEEKETPLNGILTSAGEKSMKIGMGGAAVGSISPVAAPITAAVTGIATKILSSPVVAGHSVRQAQNAGAKEYMDNGMGRHDAMVKSAMDLTGTNTRSEANARIIGAVLGSTFGSTGGRIGGSALGWATKKVNDSGLPGWIGDKQK